MAKQVKFQGIRILIGGTGFALALNFIIVVILVEILRFDLTGFEEIVLGLLSVITTIFVLFRWSKFKPNRFHGAMIALFYGWSSLLIQKTVLEQAIKLGVLYIFVSLFVSQIPLVLIGFVTGYLAEKMRKDRINLWIKQ